MLCWMTFEQALAEYKPAAAARAQSSPLKTKGSPINSQTEAQVVSHTHHSLHRPPGGIPPNNQICRTPRRFNCIPIQPIIRLELPLGFLLARTTLTMPGNQSARANVASQSR